MIYSLLCFVKIYNDDKKGSDCMALAQKIVDCEYTIDDIYALSEGQRAELIDGQMYMMATPSRKHQKVSHNISWEIETYIRSHNGDCEVCPAPFAVFLNADNKILIFLQYLSINLFTSVN